MASATYFPGRGEDEPEEEQFELSELRQYLSFTMDGERFALPIAAIKEILRNVQLAGVPLMPAHLRGVINLRGAVVPVIDLAALFERAPTRIGRHTSVIVLEIMDEDEPFDIGIMVDAVTAVVEIAPDAVEPPPSFGTPVRVEFIEGLGRVGDELLIILNIERSFALSRMAPPAALA